MIRTRTNWQMLAEKPTKYFLNLEKSNFNRKTIHKIQNTQGILVSDREEVLNEIRQFYNRLYTSKGSICKYYTDNLDIPKLPEDIKKQLDQLLTMVELGKALKDLDNSKCPGNDGLSTDFLKCSGPN